ncbi:MAG: hypothetical protein CMJ58_03150 [Planctomycetaceae bacterium]|nr:hypothetical protein [Planctomycetaceae bacterium]
MSTVAPKPPPPPAPPRATAAHRQFIDEQIAHTRRSLQWTDFATGAIGLVTGLLAFLLAAALLDHWVFRGGLSIPVRGGLFALLVAGAAVYGWRTLAPLVRPINPAYAAQTIERHAPSLKNSLLNLLMFRSGRQRMPTKVYDAIEQQAAERLALSDVDDAVDKSTALRRGYVLLGVAVLCAAYALLSPKNLATSASRVLLPWADIAAPSRVQVTDVTPGDGETARGDVAKISALVAGLHDDESVTLRYRDRAEGRGDNRTWQSITLHPTGDPDTLGRQRFDGQLPPPGARGASLGLQQPVEYWIEAGDGRTRRFRLDLFAKPTIVVQRVRYEPPSYTGLPSSEAVNTGDVEGLEGTRVTVSALANRPIRSAHIDFDADGTRDVIMQIDGDRATATFTLALRDDRRTPWHKSYVLRFTDDGDRTNSDPARYRISVAPDYAPEVQITAPEEAEKVVAVNEAVSISVDARDPDFALATVRLDGEVKGRPVDIGSLLAGRHEGRFQATLQFTPAEARLQPGQVLEYWAVAEDNRRPQANAATSERRRLRIAAPQQQPQDNPRPQDQPGQEDENPQGGNEGGAQQDSGEGSGQGAGQNQANGQGGDNKAESGESGAEGNQNQPGGEQQSGENDQQEGEGGAEGGIPGAGGGGDTSEAGEQDPNATGGQSGSGESEGDPSQNQSPSGNGDSQSNNNDASEGTSESGGAGNGGQPGDDSAQPGQNQPGNQGAGGEGQPSEPVSANGDDDGTAFDRIAEHFANQDQQNPSGGQQKGGESTGANSDTNNTEGGPDNGAQSGDQPNAQQNNGDNRGSGQPNNAVQANPSPNGQANDDPGQQQPAGGQSGQGRPKPGENTPGEGPQNPPDDTTSSTPSGQDNEHFADENAGRGNPEQQSESDPAGVVNNPNQGEGGSGSSAGEAQAPHDADRRPNQHDKHDADGSNNERRSEEATQGGLSKEESDTTGGPAGEESGGGSEGAGQRANSEGRGAPGENTAAEEGAGAADEHGMGETGSQAGSDQLTDGQTGQSSQDQPGAGSESRESGDPGSQTGGPDDQGDAGEGGQNPTESDAQQQPGSPEGQQPSDPSGQRPEAQPDGPQQQPQQNEAGEQSPQSSEQGGSQPGSAGAAQQPGGASGSSGGAPPPGGEGLGGDEANLQYAQQQTDLILNRLDEQLAQNKVDEKLLDKLGWSADDLQRFVNRWKALKEQAQAPGQEGIDAEVELDDALRSLGLRPGGAQRIRGGAAADDLGDLNDAYRERAPRAYQERVRAYVRGAAAAGDSADD